MHPLDTFQYCPHCGSKNFKINGVRSKECPDCGFVYYFNPAAAVAAMIMNDNGEILLTRRAFEPAKGTWDLPGGFAELDETLEDALKREITEELHTELTDIQYFCSFPNRYPFGGMVVHTLDSFFLCKAQHPERIKTDDDVDGYKWVKINDIAENEIGLGSIKRAIGKLKQEKSEHQ